MNTLNVAKEIIFSEWQWITVIFTFVAIFAMILGRYPLKITINASMSAFLFNLIFVSFFLYFDVTTKPQGQPVQPVQQVQQEQQSQEVQTVQQANQKVNIDERLLEVFEDNKERVSNKELVALVEPTLKDGNPISEVYVKNFHEEWDFNGKVRIATFDEDEKVIKDEVFQIALAPGEMKKIHSDFGNPNFQWFRYEFYPEG